MMKMKDSGIEWIGEIPVNWSLIKGKYIFVQRNQKGNHIELQLLSPTQNYGVIPQWKYEKLSGMVAVKLNEKADLMQFKTIHKGDFCISLRSFQGGFEYSKYEGVVSPAYQVFYPITNIYDGYYKYLFKDRGFIEKINSYTMTLRDGKNIAFNDFGNTYIPFPPFFKQQSIANYLDTQCTEIDNLKADIQKQIETLEEYERSVITEAVTKGLNPDVEMRESEIEWIGEIPKNWRTEKVKFHLIRKEPRNPGNKQVLSVYREYGVIPKDCRDDNHNVTSEDTSKYKYIVPDNFVINKMKAWQGSMGISDYEGIVSPAYFVYVFTDNSIVPKYLHYLFRNCYKDEFRRISGGIREGQWDLSPIEFANTILLIPPQEEQAQIIDFLEKKIIEIDIIISEKKQQIETLEEYKKSLIFEYVTGKKEIAQ